MSVLWGSGDIKLLGISDEKEHITTLTKCEWSEYKRIDRIIASRWLTIFEVNNQYYSSHKLSAEAAITTNKTHHDDNVRRIAYFTRNNIHPNEDIINVIGYKLCRDAIASWITRENEIYTVASLCGLFEDIEDIQSQHISVDKHTPFGWAKTTYFHRNKLTIRDIVVSETLEYIHVLCANGNVYGKGRNMFGLYGLTANAVNWTMIPHFDSIHIIAIASKVFITKRGSVWMCVYNGCNCQWMLKKVEYFSSRRIRIKDVDCYKNVYLFRDNKNNCFCSNDFNLCSPYSESSIAQVIKTNVVHVSCGLRQAVVQCGDGKHWILEYGNEGQITTKFDALKLKLIQDQYIELDGKHIEFVELVADSILILISEDASSAPMVHKQATLQSIISTDSTVSAATIVMKSRGSIQRLNEALTCINNEFSQLKLKYNDETLSQMMNNDVRDLVDKESLFNMELSNYKAILHELTQKSCEMTQYISGFQQQIDVYSVLNTKHYTKWNAIEILVWICNVENGAFNVHKDQLRNGLITGKVTGEQIPYIDIAELSYPPFNILSLHDRREIVKHFKSLLIDSKANVATNFNTSVAINFNKVSMDKLLATYNDDDDVYDDDEKINDFTHVSTRNRNENNYQLEAQTNTIAYTVLKTHEVSASSYRKGTQMVQARKTTSKIPANEKKSSVFRKIFGTHTKAPTNSSSSAKVAKESLRSYQIRRD